MSYSVDLRKKVLKIREKGGLSIKQTAQRFHLSTASITRWLKRIEPASCSSRRPGTGGAFRGVPQSHLADEEARQLFQEKIADYQKQGKSLVYLDESGFAQDMPRLYG